MTEKGEKLSERIVKVRRNIEDTKRLVAYHKKMLKIYHRKEAEIKDRLEKEQLGVLFKTVKDKGCDIEALNTAINNGEFSAENVSEDADNSISGTSENTKNKEDKTDED